MVFCPDWVFEIAIARTAHEFLANDVPMFAAAGKYSDGLAEKYAPIDKSEINETPLALESSCNITVKCS